jgi:polysaccharide biosynthesis transport protein
MSRIFDAMRKAEAPRTAERGPSPASAPLAAVTPLAAAPPHAVARALTGPVPVVSAEVLVALPDQVSREMTTLRVTLESALGENVPRTLLFTSSQGGEGTSTIAAQFVILLATDSRARVLFVDANAQRPALSIAEPGPLAGLFGAAAEAPGGGRVHLLAVPETMRRDRLFPPMEMKAMLDAIGSRYDWIILDGPPVLYASEAASLGAVVDGVILVVESGRTKKPVLSRSVDLLRKAGARVMGSVLNRRQLEIPEFIYRRI